MAPPARNAPARPAPSGLGQINGPTIAAACLLIVALVGALYFFLLYQPLSEERATEEARRGAVQANLRRAQEDLRRYNADVQERERLRSRERELSRVLPDTADIPGFMRSINTLAEASGLSISLIQPDREVVEQYYARVPVRLEVTGSYLALARFFRAVSQLPRVINMENISLATPAEENGEVKLHARVLATTFRRRAPGEAATTPAGGRGAAAAGARR